LENMLLEQVGGANGELAAAILQAINSSRGEVAAGKRGSGRSIVKTDP
jgi:hypothetical protein